MPEVLRHFLLFAIYAGMLVVAIAAIRPIPLIARQLAAIAFVVIATFLATATLPATSPGIVLSSGAVAPSLADRLEWVPNGITEAAIRILGVVLAGGLALFAIERAPLPLQRPLRRLVIAATLIVVGTQLAWLRDSF